MMEKKATCVGKRLCVGIVIAPSQNRLVYASLVHRCNTHVLGPTISYICMCKNSYGCCEHSSEVLVAPTKKVLLMYRIGWKYWMREELQKLKYQVSRNCA